MKIFIFSTILFMTLFMAGCSGDNLFNEETENNSENLFENVATKVNIGEHNLNIFYQDLIPIDTIFSIEYNNDENFAKSSKYVPFGYENAYFYIRIDNKIPGTDARTYSPNEYFPRQISGSVHSSLNTGLISTDIEWKSNNYYNQYIFASDGIAVSNILQQVPSIQELFKANKIYSDNFQGLKSNIDKLHVIWYVCKKESDGWHVDGVLTTKEKTNVSETDYGDEIAKENEDMIDDKDKTIVEGQGEVEVDIHHQDHLNWDEIKTSIHIRDTANVRVVIPIDKEYQIEQDDFAIRTYRLYYQYDEIEKIFKPYNGQIDEYNSYIKAVDVTVLHNTTNITITVVGIEGEMIGNLKDENNDGLTIEVHSYVQNLSDKEIKECIESSTVETFKPKGIETPLKTIIYGQIHQKEEIIEKWVKIGNKEVKDIIAKKQ